MNNHLVFVSTPWTKCEVVNPPNNFNLYWCVTGNSLLITGGAGGVSRYSSFEITNIPEEYTNIIPTIPYTAELITNSGSGQVETRTEVEVSSYYNETLRQKVVLLAFSVAPGQQYSLRLYPLIIPIEIALAKTI